MFCVGDEGSSNLRIETLTSIDESTDRNKGLRFLTPSNHPKRTGDVVVSHRDATETRPKRVLKGRVGVDGGDGPTK